MYKTIVCTADGCKKVWKYYSVGKFIYITYTHIPNVTSRPNRIRLYTFLKIGLSECRRHMRI